MPSSLFGGRDRLGALYVTVAAERRPERPGSPRSATSGQDHPLVDVGHHHTRAGHHPLVDASPGITRSSTSGREWGSVRG
jgi:hypothetical protein